MTQEEHLVLMDLCARLPYKVRILYDSDKKYDNGLICQPSGLVKHIGRTCILAFGVVNPIELDEFKPYLRPLYSITNKEFSYLQEHLPYDFTRIYSGEFDIINDIHLGNSISIDDMAFFLECLNKWHLDYRGLIPKGLALEAPKGMYNIKTE